MITFSLLHLIHLCGFLASCPVGLTKCRPVKPILLPIPAGLTGIQTHYANTVRWTTRSLNMRSSTAQLKLRNGPPTSQESPTSALPPRYGPQLCSSKDSQTTSQLPIQSSRPQPLRLRSVPVRTAQLSGSLFTASQDPLTQLQPIRLFFFTLYFIAYL